MRETLHRLTIISSLALAAILICVACADCGGFQKCAEPLHRNDLACAVAHDIVDCTTPEAKTLIAEFGPLVLSLVEKYTGDGGTVDWSGLLPAVKSAGIADGMCVLSDVVLGLRQRSSAEGAPGRPKFESLAIGFDQLRVQIAPGVTFRTARGDL